MVIAELFLAKATFFINYSGHWALKLHSKVWFILLGIYKPFFLNYLSHPAYHKPTSALLKSVKRLLLISTSMGSDPIPKSSRR